MRSACPVVRASRASSSTPGRDWAKQRGARGLAYVLFNEDGSLGGPAAAKNLSEAEQAGLAAFVGAEPADCVFFAAGSHQGEPRAARRRPRRDRSPPRLPEPGRVRVHLGRRRSDVRAAAADAVASGDVAVGAGRLDRRAPRVHRVRSPSSRTRSTTGPRLGPRLRVRHRVQRLRARRRFDPHPPRKDVQKRVFEVHGHQRRAGRRAVRLPARRVQVRGPAARRDRARHGPRAAASVEDRVDP